MRRFFRAFAPRESRVRFSELWERAKTEHSTPREIGLSVAVGLLSACTPMLGLHMWIALGLATLFRLNRLWAFLGSRLPLGPVFAAIAFIEIETGHRLRTGSWVALTPRDAVTNMRDLFTDWLVGTPIVGGGLATCAGLLAYRAARRWKTTKPPTA